MNEVQRHYNRFTFGIILYVFLGLVADVAFFYPKLNSPVITLTVGIIFGLILGSLAIKKKRALYQIISFMLITQLISGSIRSTKLDSSILFLSYWLTFNFLWFFILDKNANPITAFKERLLSTVNFTDKFGQRLFLGLIILISATCMHTFLGFLMFAAYLSSYFLYFCLSRARFLATLPPDDAPAASLDKAEQGALA